MDHTLQSWHRRFQVRRTHRPDFALGHVVCADERQRAQLARSLAHFQLGESGSGAHLFAAARRLGGDHAVPALQLFVAEEQDHARWLGQAVTAMGGTLVARHWSAAAFVRLRHLGGARGEMLVLLLAEIVGAGYYRMLAAHAEDPGLRAMLAQIARDESVHLGFQVAWHRPAVQGLGRVQRRLLAGAVWLLFRLVCVVVLLQHGKALGITGGRWRWWRLTGRLFAHVVAALLRTPAPARALSPAVAAATSRP